MSRPPGRIQLSRSASRRGRPRPAPQQRFVAPAHHLDLERARTPRIVAVALDEALGISDVAGTTGVSTHTLRYYERAGLMLEPIGRASSNHRRYSDAAIQWVVFLTRLRRTGMPIRRMREYANLVRAGDGNEADRLALLEAHR